MIDDLGDRVPLDADGGAWALACGYPYGDRALAALAADGVSLLVNLHERAHPPARLAAHGLREVHVPVPDFGVPTPEQIDRVVATVDEAVERGEQVAVHCGAGLGRTGTLLACCLVARGAPADEAIARVRQARPGAIETAGQADAVRQYAARRAASPGA